MSPVRSETLRRLVLEVPNRRRIFDAITRAPGTHARRLARELEMAPSVVAHHVRQLVRFGLVFAHDGGRRRSLYSAGLVDAGDAAHLHVIVHPTRERLLRILLEDGHADVTSLAKRLGCPATTVSHHLRRMRAQYVLDAVRVGRRSIYSLRSPATIGRLLALTDADAAMDGCFVGLVARADAVAAAEAPVLATR